MSQILEDSTVIPSYLSHQTRGSYEDPGLQNNLSLRSGEVRKIIYPSDADSVSGRYVEYNVDVQQKDKNGTGVTTKYANCLISNLFGGAADVFKYTLREDDQNQPPADGVGVGSKVILLCLNGTITKAVIIGGLRDTGPNDPNGTLSNSVNAARRTADDMADGHNMYWEFNGVNANINDDGELQVMYRGKTNADGTLDSGANADAEGTSILFNKDGSLKLFTPKEDQSFFIDHANKKIVGIANSEWDMTVNNGPINFNASSDINYNSSGGGMSVGVAQNIKMNSLGVLVGGATDAWVKGTTYRLGETTMNTQLITAFTTLTTIIATASAALIAAGSTPIPPVIAAGCAAAGGALASAAAPLAIIVSAITAFEAQAATYLSLKNLTD